VSCGGEGIGSEILISGIGWNVTGGIVLSESGEKTVVEASRQSLSMDDDKVESGGICFSVIASVSFLKTNDFAEKSHLIASMATSGELDWESAL